MQPHNVNKNEFRQQLDYRALKFELRSHIINLIKESTMEVITIEKQAFVQLMDTLEKLTTVVIGEKVVQQTEWLTGKEVMKILDISSRTLQTYRDSGSIGFAQLGRKKIYYRKADVEQFLNNKYNKPFNHGK